MTNQKKIYIVRHGQTEFNKQSIVQGSGVDTELNEKGKWQARQATVSASAIAGSNGRQVARRQPPAIG